MCVCVIRWLKVNLLKPSSRILLTTRFNIKKSYLVLTLNLCVFVDLREKTATFALHTKTDWICITKGESVYCAVRTESLHVK